MNIIDTYTLARTKLRTRRVRTGLVMFVSALLFGVLCLGVLVLAGIENSASRLMDRSASGRYIVTGHEQIDYGLQGQIYENPEVINEAIKRHEALVAEKTAFAKKLDIDYDPKSEIPPYSIHDAKTNIRTLNYESNISAREAGDEWLAKHRTKRSLDDFKKFADPYNPSAYYSVNHLATIDGQATEMANGQENLALEHQPEQSSPMSYMPDDYASAMLVPQALVSNYLSSQHSWSADSGRIPVIVTQKRAETLTGLTAPKKEAPATEKLDYASKLRQAAIGKTFDLCYRNKASSDTIQQAKDIKKEMAAEANNKDYKKPSLIYGLPDPASCGEALIIEDKRSGFEKSYMSKRQEFEQKFGNHQPPMSQKLTYQIVGVAPNTYAETGGGFSIGISEMLDMIFMPQGFRFAVPAEMYQQLPASLGLDKIFGTDATGQRDMFMGAGGQYYVEFSSAEDARSFIKNESCQYGGMGECLPKDKWFMLMPHGSNSIALDDASRYARIGLLWAGGFIMIFAAVIAGLTIGRTIADSRRETAVFRAIGFRRQDVSSIYVAYTSLLSFGVMLRAVLLGLLGALIIDRLYWVDTTARLKLLLGIGDGDVEFHFYDWSPLLLLVLASIFASALLGAAIPLIRNMRRNPINDMRDE